MIIKRIAIWGVWWLDVSGDVVGEIFLQPTLGSSTYEAWHRVLLPDVESSITHPLDPGQNFLLQILDVGLRVESETTWEIEWRHNITIDSYFSKRQDVDWVFGFHHYWYILWGQNKPTVVLWVHIWAWQKFFSSKKKQSMFSWRGFLSLLKSFTARSSHLSFMACD